MTTRENTESGPTVVDRLASLGRETLEELRGRTMERWKENPVLYAGVAATAGFLVGGGLLSGMTLRLLQRSMLLTLQLTVVPALLARVREAVVEQMP